MNNDKRTDQFIQNILNKVDRDVLNSLSVAQLSAIKVAIRTAFSHKKQGIDLRGAINLFFMKFYYGFFAGRDRRISTETVQGERRKKMNLLGSIVFLALVFSGFILLAILALHGLKILLGINIFPETGISRILGL